MSKTAKALGIKEPDVDRLIANRGLRIAAIESIQTVISATLDTSDHITALHFGGPATVIIGHARAGSKELYFAHARGA